MPKGGAVLERHCAEDRGCGDLGVPRCSRTLYVSRTWGGIGNTLPIYAGTAANAFQEGCTAALNESRSFQLQHHFHVPDFIPPAHTARRPECAARALTLRPSAAVAALVEQIHEQLQTGLLGPGLPRATATGKACCRFANSTRRILIGFHLRTFWADIRSPAETYEGCPAQLSMQEMHWAADNIHALFLPAAIFNSSWSHGESEPAAECKASVDCGTHLSRCHTPVPTMRTLVDFVLCLARRNLGKDQERSLALFVASDSPAAKHAACRHSRRRGVPCAHTPGEVWHNNLWREALADGRKAAETAATAMADLVMLSHAGSMRALTRSHVPTRAHTCHRTPSHTLTRRRMPSHLGVTCICHALASVWHVTLGDTHRACCGTLLFRTRPSPPLYRYAIWHRSSS